MNSWDLFDTLVAGRDISTPCGDQPEQNYFPILENIAQVRPDDIIVSDYYDSAKAHRVLVNITKLSNRLIVGDRIKLTGEIWRRISVECHTGDQHYELITAKRAGIRTALTRLALFTTVEQELYDAGFKGLALTIREARLGSYSVSFRQLQLLQNQANVPFLFLASILLHRKVMAATISSVLMCSRDACLWWHVQEKVRSLFQCNEYRSEYFYTSRLTRYFPSPCVVKYTKSLLTDRTLIADLCGTGQSLRRFVKHLPSRPLLWLVVGYLEPLRGGVPRVPYAIEWLGTTAIELANLAKHPMIVDIAEEREGAFVPVSSNPGGIDWTAVPQINAMHEACDLVMSVMCNYDFSTDLRVENASVLRMLGRCYQRIEQQEKLLGAFAAGFFDAEEHCVRKMIWEKAVRS